MKKIFILYLFMFLFLSFGIQAQNIANYVNAGALTAGSNESLVDDITGWTQIIGANQLNVASAVTNIGFEVWFMGERFTTFSANTGGVVRFGNTQVAGSANTPAITGNARVSVFGPAISTNDEKWRTENNGYVRYKVTGTAPNRKLIVDWVNMRMAGSAASNTGISRFQAHIYETAPANTNGGVVRIVYGRMLINSHVPTTGCSGSNSTTTWIGIGYGISTTEVLFVNTDNHPIVTGTNINYGGNGLDGYPSCNSFGAAPTNVTSLNSASNGSRKYYNFNPPAPTQNVTFVSASCVSDNELLINWTAAAGNQVGYVVYRSTDGTNYDFIHQTTDATTSTYLDQLLTAGTTYYYRVLTVTEGKLSAITANNQVTATTTISPTVFSVISNIWSSTTTWSTNSIPLAAENVIIGCRVPHTVTVNTNGVANDLTLETNSILNFNANQTIVTEGNVINNGTINLNNNSTLRIKGNLINNAGATVNIQNGTLIVEGNFQNAATATLNGNTGTFTLKGNFTNLGAYNPNTSIMRFDGNGISEQLINHTGTSSYSTSSTATFNTTAALPLRIPPSGSGSGGGFDGSTTTILANLTGYSTNSIRKIDFNVSAGSYTGINNLFVDIDHSYNADIEIYLVTPNNTVYSIIADKGGSGDNFNNVTFTMSVATNPPAGNSTLTGSYRPVESWTGYAGTYTGTWSLYIIDDNNSAGTDIGQLNTASLTLNQTSTPPAGLQFHTVQMQNTGAGVRTENINIIINNTATWTTGVFRADNNHMLIFPDNATSTVGNNASHADMRVRKIGNDAFNFPVGNAGWVAQIGITAPLLTTDHFTANYVRQATTNNVNSKEPSIHHVGQCEYWILDRTFGNSNVQVTLSYDDIRSCTVGPTAGLKVIRWDGAIWRDHFQSGIIAAPYNGVVSLGTVNNFSPFTLGADTKDNVLPLTFLSFDAKPFKSDALLDWTTTGEKNHDYFEIERSINGQGFKGIGNVKKPISIDNTKSTYSFIDKNVGLENTEAYYRLKQIDNDGKYAYSDIKKVNWSIDNSKNGGLFVAYPNPFSDILTLDFSLDKSENVEISLIDMTGRIIKTISQSYSKGNHKVELNYLQNLAQGSYLLQFKTNTIQKTIKVVKI